METKAFKKLLKEKEPKKIIYMHCNHEIYLTGKQIDKLIDLKEKEKKNEKKIK